MMMAKCLWSKMMSGALMEVAVVDSDLSSAVAGALAKGL